MTRKFELAAQLGHLLIEQGTKVTSVESCTGGGLAHAITQIPGSSQWFEQSWVTYSNKAKHQQVGVSEDTLANHGAVSEPVVIQMAQGGLRLSEADYSISISGIAGPGGATNDKPVGLVWFAIANKTDTLTFNRRFSGDRVLVREQAIVLGLEKLIQGLTN